MPQKPIKLGYRTKTYSRKAEIEKNIKEIEKIRKEVSKRFLSRKGFTGKMGIGERKDIKDVKKFLKIALRSDNYLETAKMYDSLQIGPEKLSKARKDVEKELEKLHKLYYQKTPPLIEEKAFFEAKKMLERKLDELSSVEELFEIYEEGIKNRTRKEVIEMINLVEQKRDAIKRFALE